ncbi:hypothetical protein FC87_GL000337 [Fructilactobacillus florum DSM 22689 = JCM 16035]|nr:hypothetical protein FC87_GL000337 [Fructilactobacillus florum DSM 22689 = JCM 16035]
MKTTATYTMVGTGHETGLRRSFASVVANVSDNQLEKFGTILAELSGDQVKKVVVSDTSVLTA